MTQIPLAIVASHLVGALLMPLLGLRWRKAAYPFCLAVCVLSAFASVIGLLEVTRTGTILYMFGGWRPPVGIAWSLDGLSAFLTTAVSGCVVVVVLGLRHTLPHELGTRLVPFYTTLHLLCAGLLGMVLAADLFNLFVFLEVASLSAYALIAVGGSRGTLAAFHYLIMGTIGSSFYLLGVGYLYAVTGTLNMADMATRLAPMIEATVVVWAIGLMIVGLGIKAALVPLHGWLPDAYTDGPTATSALIAPIMTKVALYAILRILGWVAAGLMSPDAVIAMALRAAAACAIILGPLWAVAQSEFRRLLSYSSIGQIGLIVLGISLANSTALVGSYLHILNDICAKACLFLAASLIAARSHVHQVIGLHRLYDRMTWLWVAFAIAALSMVGIPPTLGFFSKWYLLMGAVSAGAWGAVTLIVVSALLSALYVFRILEQLLSPPRRTRAASPATTSSREDGIPLSMGLALGSLAVALLAFGIGNQWLARWLTTHALPPGW